MSIWAISMMRDEADVAFDVVSHLFSEGVDGVLVANNLSVDDTGGELVRAGAEVVMDTERGYYQSQKMTHLANKAAHEFGATWIVPFDADEIWYRGTDQRLADYLNETDVDVVFADMLCHYETEDDALDETSPFRRMTWRTKNLNDASIPKVCFRWRDGAEMEMGNHGVKLPGNVSSERGLTIRHFQYRGFEHFQRKVTNGKQAYDASTLPEGYGAHWRELGAMDGRTLARVYRRKFMRNTAEMIFDPAPFRHHER